MTRRLRRWLRPRPKTLRFTALDCENADFASPMEIRVDAIKHIHGGILTDGRAVTVITTYDYTVAGMRGNIRVPEKFYVAGEPQAHIDFWKAIL